MSRLSGLTKVLPRVSLWLLVCCLPYAADLRAQVIARPIAEQDRVRALQKPIVRPAAPSQAALAQAVLPADPCASAAGHSADPTVLDEQTRHCLDQAVEQLRQTPGARIALSGKAATGANQADAVLRASNAKRYLVSRGVNPATIDLYADLKPGNGVAAYVLLAPAHAGAGGVSSVYGTPVRELNALPAPAPPAAAKPLPSPTPMPQPGPAAVPIDHQGAAPPEEAAPVPVTPTPPPPAPVQTAPVQSGPDPYALARAQADWVNQLKNGKIDYFVPETMTVNVAADISVRIHGFAEVKSQAMAPVNGSDALKVSQYMSVEVLAIDAPGAFLLSPKGAVTKFVPIDGFASWDIQITAVDKVVGQRILIRISLVPEGSHETQLQPVVEKTYLVSVQAVSLGTRLAQLWQDDPVKVVKYFLPGGEGWDGFGKLFAGLIALLTSLGVVAWIRRRILGRETAGEVAAPVVEKETEKKTGT